MKEGTLSAEEEVESRGRILLDSVEEELSVSVKEGILPVEVARESRGLAVLLRGSVGVDIGDDSKLGFRRALYVAQGLDGRSSHSSFRSPGLQTSP